MLVDISFIMKDPSGKIVAEVHLKQFGTHHLKNVDTALRAGFGTKVCIEGTGHVVTRDGLAVTIQTGDNELDN